MCIRDRDNTKTATVNGAAMLAYDDGRGGPLRHYALAQLNGKLCFFDGTMTHRAAVAEDRLSELCARGALEPHPRPYPPL